MGKTVYVTGAGVSAASGIPTFRGSDGYWTIGSANYTPIDMATRRMYMNKPAEFLAWFYQRFAVYRGHQPNEVHRWLSDKVLITQNIDGLDGKAGNLNYIPIHGRMDKVTLFHKGEDNVELVDAPWSQVDESRLKESLLELFKIGSKGPELGVSLKPCVLLFDECYSELYQYSRALELLHHADEVVFMGTSFSVNFTEAALSIARMNGAKVKIVDPSPVEVFCPNVEYFEMTAGEYIQKIGVRSEEA